MPPGSDPRSRLDRFGLLASGIAGRSLRVAPGAVGERAWTDGATVFVDPEAAVPEQVIALAVQASLIAAGSLEHSIVRRLTGRSAARYLAIEAHRALSANSDLLPRRTLPLIDHDTAAQGDSAAASLAVALGRASLADPPWIFGAIHPKRLRAAADGPVGTSAENGGGPQQDDDSASDDLLDEDGDDDEFGRIPSFVTDLVGGRGPLSRLFQRMLGLSRESEGGFTGGGVPRSARTVTKPGRFAKTATGTFRTLADSVPSVQRHGVMYPEWDTIKRRYRLDWCTVTEVEPRPGDLRSPPMPRAKELQRPLAQLRLSLDRQHRRMQGDDLDIDAVVEERVELLAGTTPDEAVYIESLRRRPDLAVLVLLDVSGSSADPSPAGGTVHEQQRAAAAMLTGALHGLGNRVALYGFCSQGRSDVRLLRVKRFDDRLDTLAVRRLGALVPGAYTRLGAVIRHGAATLEDHGGAVRTLLVVLSDGLAYDHGYAGSYAEADARRALAEARRRGIGCVCLSVGAGADLVALQRVFGTAAHAALARPNDLAHIAGPLFRDALRSSERKRQEARQRMVRTRRRRDISRRIP